jgi:hypothetical protein
LPSSIMALSGMMLSVPPIIGANELSSTDPGLGVPGARKCGQAVALT